MEKLGNKIMISEKSLVTTIKSILQYNTTTVNGRKSTLLED